MAKSYGGNKVVTPNVSKKDKSRNGYNNELSSGNYDRSRSYFSEVGGGYVLFHKGHNVDKNEIEAARIMADNGYAVELTPESGVKFMKKINGKEKYVDGKVSSIEYEQSTPHPTRLDQEGLTRSVNNALEHAKSKGAEVALIYDKFNSYHRGDIDRGIKRFESNNPSYRFKAIVTVNTRREVYEWLHDTPAMKKK